jgi:hypothetical protein
MPGRPDTFKLIAAPVKQHHSKKAIIGIEQQLKPDRKITTC